MAQILDLNDHDAWDDSSLINSWNDALAEYKKYHSIHTQGKRLQDVLTDEEKAQLNADGSSQRSVSEQPQACQDDLGDAEMEISDDREAAENMGKNEGDHIPVHSSTENYAMPSSSGFGPEMLMNGTKDEGLKALMISWYYAGYYTGYYEGLRKGREEATANAKV